MKTTVCIPCYNEEKTILNVVNDFKQYLPEAEIIVFDNNSTDSSRKILKENNIKFYKVLKLGKGNVIKEVFKKINTEYLILIDGDSTYDVKKSKELLKIAVEEDSDMLIAKRVGKNNNQYRFGHIIGNKLFSTIAKIFFGSQIEDLFSGYRIFKKNFYKTCLITSKGFSVETEISIHAIQIEAKILEVESMYFSRQENSFSKLNTFKDGFKIANFILSLILTYKSHYIYYLLGVLLCIGAVVISIPQIFIPWYNYDYVEKIASVILVTGLGIIGFISIGIGIIINNINSSKINLNRIFFQSYK